MLGSRPMHPVPPPAGDVGAQFCRKCADRLLQGRGQRTVPVLAVGQQVGVSASDGVGHQVFEPVEEDATSPVGRLPAHGGKVFPDVVLQQTPQQSVPHRAVDGRLNRAGINAAGPIPQHRQRRCRSGICRWRNDGKRGHVGFRRDGYPLGMDAAHVGRRSVGDALDAVGHAHGAVAGRKVHRDVVRIVRPHRPVVGRHDVARRRIDVARHVREGDAALPLVLPVPSGNRQGSRHVAWPAGNLAPALVTDVAVNVGHHEVVHRVNPALHGVGQLVHAGSLKHGGQDVRPRVAAVAGGVSQGQAVSGQWVAAHHRAVMGRPGAQVHVGAVLDPDNLVANVGVVPVLLVLVEGRIGVVEQLDVQVLVVGGGMGHAPGHPLIVPEVRKAGHADEGVADHVEGVAGQVVLVIDAGRIQAPVAVAGQQPLAGGGTVRPDGPRVGPAVHLADEIQVRGVFQQLLQAQVHRAIVISAGRDDDRLARRVGREQRGGPLRAQRLHQPCPPRLGLEHAH